MPISKSQRLKLIQLGARVKLIRDNKNLTLKELAHSIGKDPQSIHRLESGAVNPSFLYLFEVCKGLDIDIDELLNSI